MRSVQREFLTTLEPGPLTDHLEDECSPLNPDPYPAEKTVMPKDPTKNIANYKIAGGTLNEYEFEQNQLAMADQGESSESESMIPGTPPEEQTQLSADEQPVVTEQAATSTQKSSKKTSKASSKKKPARKAAGKSAQKASKKSGAASKAAKTGKKAVAKKSSKKVAAKSSKKAGKKGAGKAAKKAAKKSGGKKAAKKSARKRASKK